MATLLQKQQILRKMPIFEENHPKWLEYKQYKKCGLVSIDKSFAAAIINCQFCLVICTEIAEFIQHIQIKHSKHELYNSFTQSGECEERENDEKTDFNHDEEISIKLEQPPSVLNKFTNDDPIAEEPANDDWGEFDNLSSTSDMKPWETIVEAENEFVDCNQERKIEKKDCSTTDEIVDQKLRNTKKLRKLRKPQRKEIESKTRNQKTVRNTSKLIQNTLADLSDSDCEKPIADTDSEEDDYEDHLEKSSKNKDYPMCPKIDVLLPENHSIILHIIDFYQNIPFLWDYRFKDAAKKQEKIDTLNGLCLQLEIKFQIKLTPKECRRIFRNLRKHYYNDLELYGKQSDAHKPTNTQKLWCFDKLHFLGNKDEHKKKFKAIIPQQHVMTVANLYRNFPILWDFDHEDRHNKTLTEEAFEDLRKQLEPSLSTAELHAAITRIRGIFKAEKAKRIQCLDKGIEFTPDNPELYEKLSFLEDNIGPYRCTYENCLVYSRSNEAHKSHLASHEGKHAFSCKFCPKTYKTLCGVEGHILRHHTSETPFKCPFCDKSFHTAGDRRAHQNAHKEAGLNYVCHLCGKGYHTRSYLNRHQKTHEYLYKCPHCPKKYGARYRLQDHLNSHAKVRAHICKECGKGFFSSKTLYQHKQLHKEETNYQCNICGRQFKQSSAMHSHVKNHHKAADV